MKKNIFSLLFLFFVALFFLGNSSGYGIVNNEGLTGAPGDSKQANGSAKTCQACHNGGSFNVSSKIEFLNEAGTATVARYEPTKTYTIRYTITPGAGTPVGYGFQMIDIRKSNSSNTKGFLPTAQQNAGIQAFTLDNKIYAEQSRRSTSNTFLIKWKAPAAGTGTVVFYAVGNAVNGNGSINGDNGTASVNAELAEMTSSVNELANTVDMRIFPNPTTEGVVINLESKKSKNLQLKVSDISGKTIHAENWQIQVGENSKRLLVESFPKGAYMIQLVDNQDIISKKIIKL